MPFSLYKIIKGLLITQEDTLTPKQIEIVPGGTPSTKTTITSSQTTDKTVTIPDADDTLIGKATTDTLTNKSLVDSSTAIVDATDSTKKLILDAAGATGTSTTILGSQTVSRTLTLPDANDVLVGKATTDLLTNKSLSDSTTALVDATDNTKKVIIDVAGTTGTSTTIVSSQTVNQTITLPDATDTLVGKATSDTLSNKTLDNTSVINVKDTNLTIQDAVDATKQVKLDVGGATATTTTILSSQTVNRTLTLPDATDTLVGKATTDTLSNKTLDNTSVINVKDSNLTVQDATDATVQIKLDAAGTTATSTTLVSSQTANRTIVLPDASDTLVGKATVDTLTNKTLTSPVINTPTGITKADVGLSNVDNTSDATKNSAIATLTNKSLSDSSTSIVDSTDSTIKIVLDAAGTTATSTTILGSQTVNRTLTLPDATDTLVGKATTDTLSNKTLDNTSVITVKDTNLTIQDAVDATKQIKLDVAGATATSTTIVAAQTVNQTITLPDATDTLVGKATVDVLTNKDIDGGVASNTSRITLPKAAKSTLDGLTRKEGTIVYDTTGKKAYIDDGSSLVAVGSGSGGINYITNSDAETDTSGYSTFADGATLVDGTGGVPTATFARSTTSPLRGTASFLYTPGNAGDGVSFDHTISDADKAKVLQIGFDFQLSGTITEGDYQVYIYDVTNAQLIQPAPFKLSGTSGTNYQFKGTFQTASNSTSYRLIVWQSVSTAVTLKIDNISVSPQVVSTGGIATDLAKYVPTLSNNSGAISAYTVTTDQVLRLGSQLYVSGMIKFSGTPTAFTGIQISLPTGLSIDVTNIDTTFGRKHFGTVTCLDDGVQHYGIGKVAYYSTSKVDLFVPNGATTNSAISNTLPFTFGANDSISFEFSVPITGWGTSQVLSSETDTRVVAFTGSTVTPTIATGTIDTAKIIVPNIANDTHGAYNSSTGAYTVPVPGFYRITHRNALSAYSASTTLRVGFTIDSTTSFTRAQLMDTAAGNFLNSSVSDIFYLKAGQVVRFAVAHSNAADTALTSDGRFQNYSIERLSGPSQIAASESVNVSYHNSSTITTGINPNASHVTLSFPDKRIDSHGAFNGTIFTAPVSGNYLVTGTANINATNVLNSRYFVSVYKGTTEVIRGDQMTPPAATMFGLSYSGIVPLLAGETIQIELYGGGNNSTATLSSDFGCISITRVGN